MQRKRISIKDDGDSEVIERLQEELGVSRVIANLLSQRQITNYKEAKDFFRPTLDMLHEPFLMKDMDKAVERLNKAYAENEKILVYGDYDVDGTTSVALVFSYLRQYHPNLDFYIPNRYKEGYGISKQGIDYAAENGCTLVIALDCGIKAVEQMEYAKTKSIDFVICDHHTPGETIPDATAVLDPKREDCNYPYKELSGCGVGFKFMQAFAQRNNLPFTALTKFMDFLAVSIAADIVPITGENRILAYYGLKQLNTEPNIGMKAILKVAHAVGRTLTITDCVFKIGPRINAAGRVRLADLAVNLLIETDPKQAKIKAQEIEQANKERRALDQEITNEAINIMGNSEPMKNKLSTVLYKSDWHKGVIGIVASRLIETYYRPTIILTESNGFATGSARSVKGFDLYAAINSCSHLLKNFGGHKYAAGLTMKIENIEEFSECFEKYVSEHITEEQREPVVFVDTAIDFGEITPKFFRIMNQFAPFGPGNMTPVFLSHKVKNSGTTSTVGQSNAHLKLGMKNEAGVELPGIAFSMGDYYKEIVKRGTFDVCYSLDQNYFRGKVTLQAKVKYIDFND